MTPSTLLVVECDVNVLFPIQRVLKDAGFRVLSASSGDKAIKLAESFPEQIDLLLSAIRMPSMTGIELSSFLRATRPEMKSIFMHSLPAGDLLLLFEHGWNLVAKTDVPGTLIESIDEALGSH